MKKTSLIGWFFFAFEARIDNPGYFGLARKCCCTAQMLMSLRKSQDAPIIVAVRVLTVYLYSGSMLGCMSTVSCIASSPESLMLSPKSIANFMIDLANSEGQSLDPMKLQKLVYYAHGWYAGYSGEPLINEEIEAWPYGPVIPSLYDEFKRFGSGKITGKATTFDQGRLCEVPPPGDPNIRAFLQNVWRSYGRYTGVALSEMTHAQGSPWDITRRTTNGMRGADIPFDLIREHFAAAVQATRSAVPA